MLQFIGCYVTCYAVYRGSFFIPLKLERLPSCDKYCPMYLLKVKLNVDLKWKRINRPQCVISCRMGKILPYCVLFRLYFLYFNISITAADPSLCETMCPFVESVIQVSRQDSSAAHAGGGAWKVVDSWEHLWSIAPALN
jgi:hypothetical protein